MQDLGNESVAVCFLARGKHPNYEQAVIRFISSYLKHPAGLKHNLYVLYKGFNEHITLSDGMKLFEGIYHTPVILPDDGLDIGAYKRAALILKEDSVCFINTKTEILSSDWLYKLAINLSQPGVGLVGANGSFESFHSHLPAFPTFPNIHIRSNCFLMDRICFLNIADKFNFISKYDQFLFESGPRSLTRTILSKNKKILVVGADGKGYDPWQWPYCKIMRQRNTDNALIADDHFRHFLSVSPGKEREFLENITWGKYQKWYNSLLIRHEVKRLMSKKRKKNTSFSSNNLCFCGSGVNQKLCHDHPNAVELII